jgi:L-lactate dehydrogenase complex protein LldF
VIASGTRKKYFEAQAGITGCNFLIADPGSIALTENEGNILFSSGIPQVHIVLAGIDKIIPAAGDLDTLWPLLATYGTGQKITSYNTIINGPKGAKDTDGPQEVYVILIDNGRSSLLAKKEQRPALTCIKCGACSNVCPVYKTIGGHAYGIINPGPIGAVTAQHLQPKEGFSHLSGASTLCGKCDQVCPVNIEIHNLLVENRRENAENEKHGLIENYVWKMIIGAMLNRKKMNRGETFKNLIIKSSYKKDWGERREFPELAKKSFNQLWREQHNEK